MKIEKIKIEHIKKNPNNPRVINDDKFKKLVKSIKEFPQMLDIRPIVVNDNMVVLGGNMRLKACKEAGIKEVPVIKASELNEDQQREFIIKDNVGFGEWDWEMIDKEWDPEKLDEWGLDIEKQIDDAEDGEILHLEKSLQVIPKKEYILIMADDDSDEWEELKSIFKCKVVRQGGCRIGSTSDKATTGLERVFNFITFKERMIHEFGGRNTQ